MLNKKSNIIDISAEIKDEMFKLLIEGEKVSLFTEKEDYKELEGFKGNVQINHGNRIISEELSIFQNDEEFVMGRNSKILPIEYITPAEHLQKNTPNEIIKKGKKKELIKLLKIFDKNIIGIEMIEEHKKTIPYIEHSKLGLMPLSTYGDGLKKVVLLGTSIIKAKDGVLLIDEVESAIHIDALVEVFKWFIEACKKYRVQVFMTTHSVEVIDTILEEQKESNNIEFLKESLRIITIKNSADEDITKVRTLDGLKAYESRIDFGMELR